MPRTSKIQEACPEPCLDFKRWTLEYVGILKLHSCIAACSSYRTWKCFLQLMQHICEFGNAIKTKGFEF
jgi:hypothetical protein